MRATDVWQLVREAGPGALAIVTIVNVLVGGILAFVGAVQLRRFGAEIYVADLVGIAMVREMAVVMTAIVLAGRTGGDYAAHSSEERRVGEACGSKVRSRWLAVQLKKKRT